MELIAEPARPTRESETNAAGACPLRALRSIIAKLAVLRIANYLLKQFQISVPGVKNFLV